MLICFTLTLICAAQRETLLIGPGDQLKVDVFDTPEMSQSVRVTDAGEIPLMFLGNVKVADLTPAQAAHVIEAALQSKKLMMHPQISITVEEYATEVSVLGEVHNAGAYQITTPVSVIKVLSKAGGLTEVADRNITIQRHGDPTQTVKYFLSNTSAEALEKNVIVYPGDTVLVPRAGVVYVLGDVARPGGFTMSANESQMTVLQALANAGGTNKTAILSKAKLVRKSPEGVKEIPISLNAMQKGEHPDVAMQANDILYIPFSYMKNIAFNGTQIAASAASAIIYTHP